MALPRISARLRPRSISPDGAVPARRHPGWHGALLGAAALLGPGAGAPAARLAERPATPPAALTMPAADGFRPQAGADAQARLARAFNAAVPVARGALIAAQPFYLDASFADRARALDCLAAADFYEAGGDPADQRAVAQVVLNRVRHAAFPSSICGVVFEGADRPTGCQFTFSCDGSLARRRPSPTAWQLARRTAAEMLLGRVDATVGQATHYHTDWVSPPWDRTMDKLAIVKTHLFFRWRGATGAPGAFTRHYGGGEPRIARLAGLSAAHAFSGEMPGDASAGQDLAAIAGAAADAATEAPATAPVPPTLQEQGVFLVSLPVGASPDSFVRMAEQRCAGVPDCRFVGWTDPSRRATALPLPGSAVDAISFTFVRHSGGQSSGQGGRAQWNCAEFPRVNTEECLRRSS
ncbi:cell wall hydrolase [Novosphingobium sp. BL-8H]|uniref:cell wall hydrolase n=1 Tax=Novosphingobium sp. BL-8H TaxID=3127640 RepID=UPI003757297E